jgi:hypothetical protein
MDYSPRLEDILEINSSYQPRLEDIPASNDIPNEPNNKSLLSYLPSPSNVPFGVNVGLGLMSSAFPREQNQIVESLPYAALGQKPSIGEKFETSIGETLPALIGGGSSLLGQSVLGGALSAKQAKEGEELSEGTKGALSTLAIGKLLPSTFNAFRYINPKSTAKNIQYAHDILENQAVKGFNDVSDEVNKREINQIPIDESIIENARGYYPKTKQANSLINQAKTGNYNSLRKLQSDLWTRGTKLIGSDSDIDIMKGEEMLDIRDDINNEISNHLIGTGNEDLNSLLNQSRNDFYKLRDIYYSPYIDKRITKLVNPNIRKIPNNIMDIISEDSKPMQKFRDFHSGIENDISGYNAQQNALNIMKKLGLIGSSSLGGAGLYYLAEHGIPNKE